MYSFNYIPLQVYISTFDNCGVNLFYGNIIEQKYKAYFVKYVVMKSLAVLGVKPQLLTLLLPDNLVDGVCVMFPREFLSISLFNG